MQYKNDEQGQYGCLIIHPRITERHPEIIDRDVVHAWNHMLKHAQRDIDEDVYIAVGIDLKGRVIEMIARKKNDIWVVYHALTPPTKKVLKELKIERGGHYEA